ncbi:MAG: hypothetical protein OEZ06_08380 [Myxococcales bacterium]|nr:hypothetical protein [Myxococcales bacterium]
MTRHTHPLFPSAGARATDLLATLVAFGAACAPTSPLPVGSPEPSDAPDASSIPYVEPLDAAVEEPIVTTTVDAAIPEPPAAPPCGTGLGCDPTDLGGESCQSMGLGEGRLLCNPVSCTFEVALCSGGGGSAPCGTGPGCNPANLGGASCGSLAQGVGTLLCDPETCTFDTSLCSGGTGTGTGAVAGTDLLSGLLGGFFGGGDAGIAGLFGGLFGGGFNQPTMDAGSDPDLDAGQ